MKKILILCSFALLIGCTSNSEQNITGDNITSDSLNADLNNLITNTIFDSIPIEKLPYSDSLSLEEGSPLRKIKLNTTQIGFLKLKNIREISEYYESLPDKAFSLVCRLPLSGNYFSVIFNYTGENESMNYLITYDRDFCVVDYIMTAYAESMETAPRTSATIDTSGLTVTTGTIMKESESTRSYHYSISEEGFFREAIGPLAEIR